MCNGHFLEHSLGFWGMEDLYSYPGFQPMNFVTMNTSCHLRGLGFLICKVTGMCWLFRSFLTAFHPIILKFYGKKFWLVFSLDTIFLILAPWRSNILALNIWYPFNCLEKQIKVSGCLIFHNPENWRNWISRHRLGWNFLIFCSLEKSITKAFVWWRFGQHG